MSEYIEKCTVVNRLIDLENEFQQYKPFHGFEHAMYRKICEAEIAIGKTPAADVAPVVHGQWDGEGDGYADGEIVLDVWYCSVCGYCIDDGTDDPHILPNYCPNCGARMDDGW
ncbi:MAG: hypothetical protein ACI3V3_04365 [Faecousia sp.]